MEKSLTTPRLVLHRPSVGEDLLLNSTQATHAAHATHATHVAHATHATHATSRPTSPSSFHSTLIKPTPKYEDNNNNISLESNEFSKSMPLSRLSPFR